jgi:hypothetical protein
MGNFLGTDTTIQLQLEELRKQNQALIKINEDLRKELNGQSIHLKSFNHGGGGDPEPNLPPNTSISIDMIRDYVKEMLEKEECNISYIPDFVEKRLYEKIFTMLLGVVEHALETSSANFMGHQIRFYLTEVPRTVVDQPEITGTETLVGSMETLCGSVDDDSDYDETNSN